MPPITVWPGKLSAVITAVTRRPKTCVPRSLITELFSTTFWEDKMRNLNEPRKDLDITRDVPSEKRPEGEVISMEGRRLNTREEGSLVAKRQIEELRGRWSGIQASFVDDPRKAVQEADALVSSAIKQIEDSL